MELTKELKEKLEKAESKEKVKEIIGEAGMELTDEEVEQIAGGWGLQKLQIDEDAEGKPIYAYHLELPSPRKNV